MPIWLSPFHPAVVAYIIIVFDVYFLYKTLRTVIMATISYVRVTNAKKISWLPLAKRNKRFSNIAHFVIITNYKESYAKLKKTIETLAMQKYPLHRVFIVLGMEKSEGEIGIKRAENLMGYFNSTFGGVFATYHELLEGEAKGKASNESWAAKWISQKIKEMGIPSEDVLITSCDADSIVDEQYLAYLTNEYVGDKNGRYRFYWAPVLLYNNYWKLNFFIRMQTTISSVLRLAFLSDKYNLIQISTYSMSLWLLESVNYWDTDIIPEDWHIFLQAFFKHGAVVQTKPIYLVTTRDGVWGENFLAAFRNRYEQEKRWAWGVSDVPYALEQFVKTYRASFFEKVFRIIGLLETHIFWPSSFFILTIGANVPVLINPQFKRTVLGYLLPQIAGGILTFATSFVLIIAYIDYMAKHKLMGRPEYKKAPLLVMQWVLFPLLSPIISAFLSSVPALESHTRMLFGRKMEYKVTRKK